MSNEGARSRGMMLVMSSPSGAGKTTLTRKLLAADPRMAMSVSATTRPPREGEVDGRDYIFITSDAFDALETQGAFLESAEVFGNRYGTPRAAVEAALSEGRDVVFDVDWQGARALRAAAPEDVVSVFILPPSLTELRQRLKSRAKDTAAVIEKRMAMATSEISHWDEYDYVLINSDLETTFADLEALVKTERLRRHRQVGLQRFVQDALGAE